MVLETLTGGEVLVWRDPNKDEPRLPYEEVEAAGVEGTPVDDMAASTADSGTLILGFCCKFLLRC